VEAAVTNGRIEIRVFPDLESLSHEAVHIFVETSRQLISERKSFSVAISGGSTPRMLYTLLGSDQYRDTVDWKRIHVFWADERCVPPEHRDSNFRHAFESFLSKVPVPDKNIHRIRGEKGPEQGAQEYENELRRHFGMEGFPVFDLVLLGLGEEGHTASLFPDSTALNATVRLAVPAYRDRPDHNRVTLTLPVLSNALHAVFMVSGISKSRAIANILMMEQNRDRYPVEPIQSAGRNVTWLLDTEAAALLGTGRVCCSA
jgi:6-phosphogluconolactonase